MKLTRVAYCDLWPWPLTLIMSVIEMYSPRKYSVKALLKQEGPRTSTLDFSILFFLLCTYHEIYRDCLFWPLTLTSDHDYECNWNVFTKYCADKVMYRSWHWQGLAILTFDLDHECHSSNVVCKYEQNPWRDGKVMNKNIRKCDGTGRDKQESNKTPR